jgi:hypothetical protein
MRLSPLAAILGSTFALALATPAFAEEEFQWESSLKKARARSIKEQKPLLAVFRCLP